MSNPCQILACPAPPFYSYTIQGELPPPTPPAPAAFYNQEVYNVVCEAGDEPDFTGELPAWITFDSDNRRFVGLAGVWGGDSQDQANAIAQSELDTFATDNAGDVICSGLCGVEGITNGGGVGFDCFNIGSYPNTMPTRGTGISGIFTNTGSVVGSFLTPPERAWQMAVEMWAASLDIGATWNTIRLGVLWSINDSGSNLSGTPQVRYGLMSNPVAGLANGPLSAATSHFLGLVQTSASWTRDAGPPVSYSTANTAIVKRVGSTDTINGTALSTIRMVSYSSVIRLANFIEIVRVNSTTMSIAKCANNAGSVGFDIAPADFYSAFNQPSVTDVRNALNALSTAGAYGTVGALNIACDESVNGPLNALAIGWNNANSMRIHDFVFKVVA